MTYKEVADLIDGFKLPWAYYQFEQGTAVAPPFLVYFYTGDDDLKADNINYQKVRELTIELYTEEKDFAKEDALEAYLTEHGICYSKTESYIDTERMHMVAYAAEIIITEEIQNG